MRADPKQRNLFKKIEDAPQPERDGQTVYVEIDYFSVMEYEAVGGEWKYIRTIYPASMD